MLSLRVLPKSITGYFKQSSHQIYASCQILSAKDSSSSSDSSDSDSDKENEKTKKQINAQPNENISKITDVPDTVTRLNTLLKKAVSLSQENLKAESKLGDTSQKSRSENKINVAIKPKEARLKQFKSVKVEEKKPYEKLIAAAQDVAKILNGDPQKTEAELLSKVLYVKEPNEADDKKKTSTQETVPTNLGELSDLLVHMKVEARTPNKSYMEQRQERIEEISKIRQKSVSESLLINKSRKRPQKFIRSSVDSTKLIDSRHQKFGILQNFTDEQTKVQLSTWEKMEVREIKLALLRTPENVFQELIQWTEQGKLWHFPINNEQGLEQEEKVHFSEHVFMERHIKDWCPKRGPIRHFMELVCVGLSKNPYMTVEEKVRHITWYKDYFEDKKDLLHELGILDDKATPVLQSSVDKNQIGA